MEFPERRPKDEERSITEWLDAIVNRRSPPLTQEQVDGLNDGSISPETLIGEKYKMIEEKKEMEREKKYGKRVIPGPDDEPHDLYKMDKNADSMIPPPPNHPELGLDLD